MLSLRSAIVIASSFSLASCVTPHPSALADRERLIAIETRWNRAIADRDAATAAQIISEDFRYITPAGKVLDRAAVLAATADPDYTIEPFTTEDVEIRFHGDSAVVTGRFTQSGSYKGEPFKAQMRYTDVWTRKDGEWRAISAHSSVIR